MANYGTRNNWRPRAGGGRFTPRTPENTLGVSIWICATDACRRLNPVDPGAGRPATCHACGGVLFECPSCGVPVGAGIKDCHNCGRWLR